MVGVGRLVGAWVGGLVGWWVQLVHQSNWLVGALLVGGLVSWWVG